LTVVGFAAASVGSGQAAPVGVVDSGGIRVVTYRSFYGSKELTLGQPTRRLGGLSDNAGEEFTDGHGLLSVSRLANGRIVVMDDYSLKFFSATNKFEKAVGRRGRGPGEFQQTSHHCVIRADTIMVFDMRDNRPSVWTSNGQHVKTLTSVGFVADGSCRQDGTFVKLPTVRDAEKGDFVVVRRDGVPTQNLGPILSLRLLTPVPTSPSVLAFGLEWVIGDGRRNEFRVLRSDGRPRVIVRSADSPPRLSESQWLALAQRIFPSSPDAALRVARADTLRTMPAFMKLFVDGGRRVWVQDYATPTRYTAFSADGALLGFLSLGPPGASASRRSTEIISFLGDEVVIKRRDSDGAVVIEFRKIIGLPPNQ
jgi:hypothetical protein